MKKVILTAAFLVSLTFSQAQTKVEQPVDTVFVLSMKDFKELAAGIEGNVDSKDQTRKLIGYIQQRGMVVPKQTQPADKPKTSEPIKKKE